MLKKAVKSTLFILGVSIIIPLTTWADLDDYSFDLPDSNIGAYWNPNIPSPSLNLGIRNFNPALYSPSINYSFTYLNPNNTSRNRAFTSFFNEGVNSYYAGKYRTALEKFETCRSYLAYPPNTTREETMYFFLLEGLCYEKLKDRDNALCSFQEVISLGYQKIEDDNANNWIALFLENVGNKFTPADKAIIGNLLEESNPYIQQVIEYRKSVSSNDERVCFINSLK